MAVTDASVSRRGEAAGAGLSDPTGSRWVRIGHSWNLDARVAGIAATQQALAVPEPKLLMVFASFRYNLPELLAGLGEVAGDVPVIGCSTAGEIGPGPIAGSGVVVVCLGGDFSITTSCASGLRTQPRGVGEAVASGLLPLPPARYRFVLMLTDALAGDQQEMIRGAYGLLGATVPILGGGAGDNMRMETSYQIYNGQIMQNAVIAAAVGTNSPVGLSIRHGWHRQGEAMVVTSSSGSRVYTLDDHPALDLYLRRHDAPPGVDADPAAFAAFAITRPLAVARRGDVAVRHVLGADPVRRTLSCAGGVPNGATVWLATGDVASTIAAADAACADATRQLLEIPTLALLVFDCAGRRAVLGDAGVVAERQVMCHRAGAAPLAGFYTYGEIARTRGVHAFHNQTIVALALS